MHLFQLLVARLKLVSVHLRFISKFYSPAVPVDTNFFEALMYLDLSANYQYAHSKVIYFQFLDAL